MQQPPVSLQNLTPAEKERVIEAAQKKMARGIGIFLVPFFLLGALLFYINFNYIELGLDNDNLHAFINVTLVFLTILPARLFINTVLRYRKALNAWQKKVFHGKVSGKSGKIILINGQKVKLTEELAARLKTGDEAIIEVNSQDAYPLNVAVINKPD